FSPRGACPALSLTADARVWRWRRSRRRHGGNDIVQNRGELVDSRLVGDEVLADFEDDMRQAGRPGMALDGEVAWVLQTLAAVRFIVADNKPCAPQPRHHRFGNTRIGIPQNADFPGALPAFEHRREAVNGIYDRRLAQLRQP